ncbi:MAG: hypothetical protein QOI31_742 [Solirubrobacterales bacterium]|jgi:hypothetical protein|nr:hypothetical protein [Solirubrobacterales bacterium]
MAGRAAALAVSGLILLAGCGEEGEGGPVSAPSFDAVLPAGWTEGDDSDVDNATGLATQGAAAALGVPADQLNLEAEAVWFGPESEDFRTNINVLAEEIPPSVGEDQYVETSLGTVSELPGIEGLEDLDPIEVDGDAAESIEYSAAPAGQPLQFRAVALVHEGEGFNITVTGPDDEFDGASEDLDEILASWEWTD